MNKNDAYLKDLQFAKEHNKSPFYIDEDDNDGLLYIFGEASGFAYSSPIDIENQMEIMWDKMKEKIKSSCKCDTPLIWSALGVTCMRCKGKV